MDPIYLEPSELEYELTVRQMKNLNTHREKTAALRDILKREANGEIEPPVHSAPYFNSEEEIQVCSYNLRELLPLIEEAKLFKDFSKVDRISSRFLHIKCRISRIVPTAARDEIDIDELFTSTTNAIAAVQELQSRTETNTRVRRSRHSLAHQSSELSVNQVLDNLDHLKRIPSYRGINQISDNGLLSNQLAQSSFAVENHKRDTIPNQENYSLERPRTPPAILEKISVPVRESLLDFHNLSLRERNAIEDEINSEFQSNVFKSVPENLNGPILSNEVANAATAIHTESRFHPNFRAITRPNANNYLWPPASNNIEHREITHRPFVSAHMISNSKNEFNEPRSQRIRQVRYQENFSHNRPLEQDREYYYQRANRHADRDQRREEFIEPQFRSHRPTMCDSRLNRPLNTCEPGYDNYVDRYPRSLITRRAVPVNQRRVISGE